MLRAANIRKEFNDKVALSDIDLTFPEKGLVIIKGESGSGKTTLLNLLTANDFPTGGKIVFDGIEITRKNAEQYRTQYCGNIYQDYMLIEDLTVRENIELALQVVGQNYTVDDIKALLKKVDLPEEYLDKKVIKLSGGEKQRVAIARAVSKQNAMIFADEPTGNLDSKNGVIIMDLLKEISKERLVVVVSHNEKFNLEYADYTIKLMDGEIESEDLPKAEEEKAEEEEKTFDKKSKNLRPKTLARLAYWGFEKNRIKCIVSIIAFVAICILSAISMTAYFADLNWSLAHNLDQSENKNVMINITEPSLKIQEIEKFYDNTDVKPTFYYHFEVYAPYYLDHNNEPESFNDIIHNAIVYDKQVGADVKIVYGTFPEKPNEIMLPYNFALQMTKYFRDYINLSVEELVGKEFDYRGTSSFSFYTFKICGIFDEGKYFNDYGETSWDYSEESYLSGSNIMADKVFIGYGAEKIFNYNAPTFTVHPGNIYDIKIGEDQYYVYGYDEYARYAQRYAPLKNGEIYISYNMSRQLGVSKGDRISIDYGKYALVGAERVFTLAGTKSDIIIKDVLDPNEFNNPIILSTDEFEKDILVDGHQKYNATGLFFNAKNVKDTYAFFNNISKEGKDIWTEHQRHNLLEHCFVTYLAGTHIFFAGLDTYNATIIVPLMCLSLLGMIALGFVSTAYLLSSKEKSLNILRSIGCGKKNIASILVLQLLTVLMIECVIGLVLAGISCYGLSKALIPVLVGVSTNLDPEYMMPLHWSTPLIVVSISLAISAIAITAKVSFMFSKSIMENKTR